MKPIVLYPPDYRDETRTAEPLLIDRLAEYNRRQLAERRLRRRAQAAWACVWVVCAVVAVWIGWWLAR
jgi:hypothetical protein